MNEYVVEFFDFAKGGNPFETNQIQQNPDKNVSKERAKELAKPTCKTCWGKGWVLFDFKNYYMGVKFCDCVTRKIEKAQAREELRQQYEKNGKLDIFNNGYRVSRNKKGEILS